MTRNSEYWEKRIAEGTWKEYNTLEERNRDLLDMYREASLNLSDELYKLTEKINGGKGVTISDMYKNNRLNILQKHFEGIIKDLTNKVQGFAEHNMYEGFENNYSNTMKQLGVLDFAIPNKKLMEELMERPWLGNNFSNRLWDNSKVLATNLNDILTTGLQQGKTIAEISINLSNIMQKSFNICHRLIRTETMHYLNQSSLKSYKDADVEYIEVWAALDERRCKVCGEKHAKVYKLKDAPIVPLHANCRCTILPVVDEDLKETEKDKKDNYTGSIEHINDLKSKRNDLKNRISSLEKERLDIDLKILYGDMSDDLTKRSLSIGKDLKRIKSDITLLTKDISKLSSPHILKIQSNIDSIIGLKDGFISSNLKGVDIESALSIETTYKKFISKYPALKGNLNGIIVSNLPPGVYASCTMFAGSIEISKLYSNAEKIKSLYQNDLKSGYHTKGTEWDALVMHELGHALDGFMTSREIIGGYNKGWRYASNKLATKVLKATNMSKDNIAENVSKYATQTNQEWFAECFAEYMCSDTPREMASTLNKLVDELMGGYNE